jgi:hypothetical protein
MGATAAGDMQAPRHPPRRGDQRMTGIDKALLRQLLAINGSWEIGDYQIDLRKQRCDLWVGPQIERGWFGRPKAPPPKTQPHTWQHLSYGSIRFVIHVQAPLGVDVSRLPWTGTPGMPFTNALAQQVFAMFNEGMSLPSICKLMHLSLNDVWKYRFAIDNGLVKSQADPAARPAAAPPAPTVPAQAAAAAPAVAAPAPLPIPVAVPAATNGSAVPDVADPFWLRLVSGDLKLDIKVLSLKLMLTRVRSQLEVITDDEVRLLQLRDLHRYFVKNERVLSHELSQLKAG